MLLREILGAANDGSFWQHIDPGDSQAMIQIKGQRSLKVTRQERFFTREGVEIRVATFWRYILGYVFFQQLKALGSQPN